MSRETSSRRIVRFQDACVECGACVGQCNTGALIVDESTYRIELDVDRCSACGLCVEACAFSAIVSLDTPLAAETAKEERHAACSQL